MKTKNIFLLVLTLSFGQTIAQTKFQKKIGTSGNEKTHDIIKVSNGYVLAGTKNSTTTKDDMWAMRIDFNGNIIWSKTYGSVKDDRAFSIVRTNDNGFVLAGHSKGYITTGTDSFNVCITKIDSNGVWQWSKIFGGNAPDGAYSVKETNSGGLIICGFSESFGIGIRDMYVIRTDNTGNLLWARPFGTLSAIDTAFSVIETSSGEFVVAGHSNSSGSILTSITKLNSGGNIIWYKEYDFSLFTSNKRRLTYNVIENNNGEYVICGALGLGGINDGAPFVLKLDTAGTVVWSYGYLLNSGDCGAHSVVQTSDNGYILGGFMGNYYSALVKTDSNGQRQWTKCYNQSSITDSKGFSVVPSNDGGYILTGFQIQGSDLSAYLIKTDSNGDSGCDNCSTTGTLTYTPTVTMSSGGAVTTVLVSNQSTISMTETSVSPSVTTYCSTVGLNEFQNNLTFIIYPNPMTENATLEFDNSTKDNCTLTIYNTHGRLVRKITNITTGKIEIERQNLTAGLYFFQLFTVRQIIATGKLTIEK